MLCKIVLITLSCLAEQPYSALSVPVETVLHIEPSVMPSVTAQPMLVPRMLFTRLQAVITGVWAVSTVFFSSFGYTTMRTGAHMADTGVEHNIELIVGVRTVLLIHYLSTIRLILNFAHVLVCSQA